LKKLFLYLFLSLLAIIIFANYGAEFIYNKYFDKKIIYEYEKALSAPIRIAADHLSKMNKSELTDYIMNFPDETKQYIKLKPLNSFHKKEIDKLKSGELILDEKFTTISILVSKADQVVTIGPFESETETVFFISLLIFISFIILLFLFIWGRNFWNNLDILRKASIDFSKGKKYDLKASRFGYIKPITDAFNEMTDKIDNLIKSHRDLTEAISHELRTPLSRMKFEIELLKEDIEIDKLKGLASDISELDNLITELLNLSRMERDENFFNKENVKADLWLNEFCTQIKLPQNKNFKFTPLKTIRYLNGDKKYLNIALSNLIENGFKYSDSFVELKAEVILDKLQITVIDDGNGIPEDMHQKVFKPFSRLDNSRNRKTGGFGIGLAAVKMIITNHSGTIHIKPSEKGAVFIIELPLIQFVTN